MTKILDPVTGEMLTIMCEEHDEVYRCVEEKALATIQRVRKIDRTEAIRLLANSDIGMPVLADDSKFWAE